MKSDGGSEVAYGILEGNLWEWDNSLDLGIDERIILKYIF